MHDSLLTRLRDHQTAIWINERQSPADPFDRQAAAEELAGAELLWQRFAPALAALFDTPCGKGRIFSPLREYPCEIAEGRPAFVKMDHSLPITASVKARGGIFGLLCIIEQIARQSDLLNGIESYASLATPRAREHFGRHTVIVASTGNLGYSIGVVATAFGLKAEIHMSDCAKEWKKERLRKAGAIVVEYRGDYTSTVAAARASVEKREHAWFIDDESSADLFIGYAGAGPELKRQVDATGLQISPERPLVVYLPCGVGGAPGGITYGLRSVYGDDVIAVFVEPTDAPCMLLALLSQCGEPPSVYDCGLGNRTVADGLAVSRASALVLQKVRNEIDAAIAVPDADLLHWVRRTWAEAGLKLEPSAAAGFAGMQALAAASHKHDRDIGGAWRNIRNAVHVVWTTGGDLMPDEIFCPLIGDAS